MAPPRARIFGAVFCRFCSCLHFCYSTCFARAALGLLWCAGGLLPLSALVLFRRYVSLARRRLARTDVASVPAAYERAWQQRDACQRSGDSDACSLAPAATRRWCGVAWLLTKISVLISISNIEYQ
jgi:hypothetical protein